MNVDDLGPVGGVEQNVFQTARSLAGRGHQVDLLFVRDAGFEAEARSFCSSVTVVDSFQAGLHRPIRTNRRLWPAIRSGVASHPDVVYINRFSDLAWAAPTAVVARAGLVCHLHFFQPHRALRLRAAPVHEFVAVSRALAGRWERAGLDASRVSVVPNGIDPGEYPPGGEEERRQARIKLGLPPEAFVVLYCGRMHTEKGVDVLLDAWQEMALGDEEARLVLVGATSDASEYYRSLRARPAVGCEWLGATADVVTPMHAADVVVVPSRSESFGRVAIEAMATGRPVVATAVGGLPEIFDGDFARFLVPPDDSRTLAATLRSLIDWREREPQLASACIEHVRERYSLSHSTDLVETALRRARVET
jgi:glycosyltransferase involved in cell wall biosynthesis